MDLDYEILTGVNFNKPGAQSILVVTVFKNIIESYNSVMRKMGLECEILDTNFAALFNSFEHNESLDEQNNYMVIDIGCASTNLVIVVKNQVVFARNLPFGGDFFNQEIEKKNGGQLSGGRRVKNQCQQWSGSSSRVGFFDKKRNQ